MAGVSETIVREFFELHDFVVRQYRKYVAAMRDDDEVDFLVLNPAPAPGNGALPFVLESEDLKRVERALVVIKAWHTETFGPGVLTSNPELFRFLEKKSFQQALTAFGEGKSPMKIMVIPALPHDAQLREKSLEFIRSKGIDAVISFRTILAEVLNQVEPNRNYQKSDLLQTLRILKQYGFLRDPQLELFKPKRTPKK
jgi:hypothetical protein